MPKKAKPLTPLFVNSPGKPGLFSDGNSLYLQVRASRSEKRKFSKSWLFRYRHKGTGKLVDMGLGSFDTLSLKQARFLAKEWCQVLSEGHDPLSEKRAEKAAISARANRPTFEELAHQYIETHRKAWKSATHVRGWRNSLKHHAYSKLGNMDTADIGRNDVLEVLKPIWTTKTHTASRVRMRIEAVLDFAQARGLREGENPARWRGGLKGLLPEPARIYPVRHHASLPYAEVPSFMAQLRESRGMAPRALEFVVLTALRSSEVTGARWAEFDIEKRVWTVPSIRMKGAKFADNEHEVPLSARCLAIIDGMKQVSTSTEYIFPGIEGKPISGMALRKVVARVGVQATPHGFRTSFRTWLAEETNFPSELGEMALAHKVGSAVERVYQRGKMLEKRRAVMDAWAQYCEGEPLGSVVSINMGRK